MPQQNLAAARVVLENAELYGGEDSGLARWARLIAAKYFPESQHEEAPTTDRH